MKKLAILLLILIAAIGYFFLETKPFSVAQQDDLIADNSELINPNLCTGRLAHFKPCLQLSASFDVDKYESNKDRKTSDELLALGMRYELGIGIKADDEKSHMYYLQSANLEDDYASVFAAYFLSINYLEGNGVEKDIDESLFWAMKSADKGYDKSAFNSALFIFTYKKEQYYSQAIKYLEQIELDNFPQGYKLLAQMYYFGYGVKPDSEKIVEYLNRGVELNEPSSIGFLGALYMLGEHVEQDREYGLRLLSKASELGHKNSQELLEQIMSDAS